MNRLARRLASSLLQILLLSALSYFLLNAVPGDYYSPAAFELGASPGALARWRADHGLDVPWFAGYRNWMASVMRGEFGRSLAYGVPVASLLRPRIGKTLQVVAPSLACCWLAGLGLAVAAVRSGRMATSLLESAALLVSLVPDVIGVSLLLWLAVWMGAFSAASGWLPVVCLTLMLMPSVVMHATSGLAEVRGLEFVLLAERRGVAGWLLWRGYIFPAAANTLTSLAGLSVAGAMGSSLLVEALLGWPGLGSLFWEAAQARDYPVVASVVTLLGAVMIAFNLLGELVLYRLDPRIRLQS